MKKYLEYKDEKSHKFWEIEVKDNTHTVTYGKVDTNGRSSTKTFDTAEMAQKDAEKLIKAKIKKGYTEISNQEIAYKTLSFEEAEKEYKLDYEMVEILDAGYPVLVFEGNTTIDGDFANWAKKFEDIDHSFLLFTGNLTVNGTVKLDGDIQIVVLGNLVCDYFYSDYTYNLIVGNANIKYAIALIHNDAYTDILGKTTVPFYFNEDNASSINPSKQTICFGTGMSDDEDLSFLGEDLKNMIKAKYLEDFDFDLFVEDLKQGKSPFINIADKDFLLEFEKKELLKNIRIKPGKKITSFTIKWQDDVVYVLEMPFLKNLTIKNIDSIPEELINKTSIEKLTIDIKLVATNENIAKAVGNFKQIKELIIKGVFYRYKFNLDETAPVLFKNLSNLKKLTIHEINNTAFELLPNLESVNLTMGDSSDISGQHNLLKKLVIHHSRGEFETIHQFPNLREFHLLKGFRLNKMAEPLQLEKLKKVILEYNYISEGLKQFYTCPNLEYLSVTNDFSATKRNDVIGIGKLQKLKYLALKIDLSSSYGRKTAFKAFDKQNINEIATLKNLKTLDLTGSLITAEDFEYLSNELPNTNISATIDQYDRDGYKKEFSLIKSKKEYSISIYEYYERTKIKKCKSLQDAFEKTNKLKRKAISEGWGRAIFIYNNSLGGHHPEYSARITLKNNELTFKYSYKDENDNQVENIKVESYNSFYDAEKALTNFLIEKVQQGYRMCD